MIIFGAGGQLAFAFSQVFPNARCYTHADADITDADIVQKIFEETKPDIIVNAAAYPNAELAEEKDTLEAYRVNVLGAINLARMAKKYNAILIQFSTDYVFDGNTEDGFIEEDAPSPRNIHGLSKHAMEEAVRAYAEQYYLIRTSALFGPKQGSFGNNFVTKRIAQSALGQTISMVADQWTVPTYTFDVATGVLAMLTQRLPYGMYHVVNSGGGVSWYDFTKEIFRTAGLDCVVTPATTEEVKSLLFRPAHSVLRDTKLGQAGIRLLDWRDSLKLYIDTYR